MGSSYNNNMAHLIDPKLVPKTFIMTQSSVRGRPIRDFLKVMKGQTDSPEK